MKNSNLLKFCIVVFVVILIFNHCKEEELLVNEQSIQNVYNNAVSTSKEDGMIEIGEVLNDPYLFDNMEKAYSHLKSANKNTPNIKLKPTHLYLRFLPKDEVELQELKKDTNIVFFDFPLNCEIKNKGTHYHDPTLPDSVITWQYTVVKIDYKYKKNIKHEVLYKVFIPEIGEAEIINNKDKSGQVNSSFYEELEYTSFKLTGNIDTTKTLKSTSGMFDRWTPEGTIQVYDDEVGGLISLKGAHVQVRYFVNIDFDITDDFGYFRTKDYLNHVQYSIKWERAHYDIRDGYYLQAWFNGPKMASDWNLNIVSGKSLGFATVHRAAQRMFYGDNGGLPRALDLGKLKYSYFDKSGTGDYNWGTNLINNGLIPDIRIFGGGDNTDVIFRTTTHENGHAMHFSKMGATQYFQVSDIISESWADAVEWLVSRIEYNDLGFPNYGNPASFSETTFNKQSWTSSNSHEYTPLFIDLIDGYNQSYFNGGLPLNRCPDGGRFDGSNCYISTAPSYEKAFIYDDKFYYTPYMNCGYPELDAKFDGANCLVEYIPETALPFIWYNSYYYKAVGNPDYPFDNVNGYNLPDIINKILPDSYGLSSLSNELKSHKPSSMTNKHINLFLEYFFNL